MNAARKLDTAWIHPFTRTGHGTAPFRVVGYEKSTYQPAPGEPVRAGSSCDHCGTSIMHVFWILGSGVGEERFKVGIDCVHKTRREAPEMVSPELEAACKALRKTAEYQARAAEWKAQAEARKAAQEAERAERIAHNRIHCAPMIAQIEQIQSYGTAYAKNVAADMLATIEKGWPLSSRQAEFLAKLAEESKPRAKDSAHIGTMGERGKFTLTVTGFVGLPSVSYGYTSQPRCIVKMSDSEGNLVVWFTGAPDMEKGKTYSVTGTVTAHGERDGQKQTTLKNCRFKEV